MLDPKTKARIAQESHLPTHDDCEAKKKTAPLSALERFIYNQEPVEDGEWREQLKAAIVETREAEATRAAGLVETIEAVGKINRPEISNHTDAWQRQTQIHNLITTVLTNYNNQVNK